jgi:hypothetical protein
MSVLSVIRGSGGSSCFVVRVLMIKVLSENISGLVCKYSFGGDVFGLSDEHGWFI